MSRQATSTQLSEKDLAKLQSFEQARVTKRRYQILASIIGGCFFLFIATMFSDALRYSVLETLGLDFLWHERAGVYADCSKAFNRRNRFCSDRASGSHRSKQSGSPFSLSD